MTSTKFCDIMVIGAGPAGSTAAFLLASRGYEVILADRKRFPRQKLCAGLLTRKTMDLIQSIFDQSFHDLNRHGLICGIVRNYRIFNGAEQIAQGRLDYPFHLTDRQAYDHFWLQTAAKAGVHTITGQPVRHVDPDTASVTLVNGKRIRARIVIGADGVWSITRRSIFNSPQSKKQWFRQLAMTMESRLPETDQRAPQNYAALHFGYIPWGYAWSFPARGHRIVGIAGLRQKDDLPFAAGFNRFLTAVGLPAGAQGCLKGHPLPMGNYLNSPGLGKVLLVGDACGLADPLLGEGIYYAHRSAEIAARSIVKHGLAHGNPVHAYQRVLTKEVLGELKWIKAFRNMLFIGGRRRRFRGLKLLFRVMPKRLEAAVQGQIRFSKLLCP